MPSKHSDSVSFVTTAKKLARQQQARSVGGRSSRGIGRSRIVDAGSQVTSETLDLAREMAGMMLRTAATIGQDLADLAAEIEPVLSSQARHGRPGRSCSSGPGTDSTDEITATALELPDAAGGDTVAKDFVARNDSLDTVDALSLRCAGLFGAGAARIDGSRVTLSPVTVALAPRSTVTVTCQVKVPRAAKPGRYIGLIETPERPGVQLLVTLNVL